MIKNRKYASNGINFCIYFLNNNLFEKEEEFNEVVNASKFQLNSKIKNIYFFSRKIKKVKNTIINNGIINTKTV